MAEERPFEVAEIDHIVLRCRDQMRMLDFYGHVLGLKEVRRIPRVGLIQLRVGQSIVDLTPVDQRGPEEGRNVDHFCFGLEIGDIEALVSYLEQHKVEIVSKPGVRYGARGYGQSMYVKDPEGNVVELKRIDHEAPGAAAERS